MMIQLSPPIPVRVPPDIDGLAPVCIDRGKGHHLEWVVQLLNGTNAGCSWTFINPQVRFNTSISDGWLDIRPFTEADKKQFHFLQEPDNGGEPCPS